MYLRYPNTDLMTVAVEMEKSGNTASGVLSAEQTGVAGYPLLVIQLIDTETSSLIVACATAVKVSDVRGDLVIDSRAPSPSEIIYIGRSPYINPSNGHWMQWDVSTNAYVDTEVVARGLPATFTARATTLPAGSDATASITGTAENPVLNVGVPKGQDSAVLSVNGQTGAVQVNDENVPSNIDGKANVEQVLSYHSQQIATLEDNQAYRAGDVITIPCNYRLFTARCGWDGRYALMLVVLDKPVIGTITPNNVTLPYEMQMFISDQCLDISNQSVNQVQSAYKNLVQLLIAVTYSHVFASDAIGVFSCNGNLILRVT